MFGFFRRIFQTKSYEQEVASNLFEALALEGGPGNDHPDFPDFEELKIPVVSLPRFGQKRSQLLCAMLFVSAATVRAEKDKPLDQFLIELSKVLQKELGELGVTIVDHFEVGNWCFAEAEQVLEDPRNWAKVWLREFYSSPEEALEHTARWANHCTRQFEAMQSVIRHSIR